jgi:hypothetical protein
MSTLGDPVRATTIDFRDDLLVAVLEDGREVAVPLEWFPRLRDATESQRRSFRLVGRGIGIHWPELDEDISVEGLLAPPLRAERRRRVPGGAETEQGLGERAHAHVR